MIVDVFIHWLHLMAAVTWIGGMIFTSFVLQPVMRVSLTPQERMPLYHEMGKKFKFIQLSCLLVLLATGLQKLWQLRESPAIFQSSFGNILAVKLILVLVVLVLSVYHSFIWGPQLTALRNEPQSPAFRQLISKMVFWGRLNMALAVAIIFCATLLRFNPF